MNFFKKICVVGLGYIGLPTAAVFASRKIQVYGVDVNQEVVEMINEGEIHIVEPELDILVRSVVTEGYLKAGAVPDFADAFIIAVPTPLKGDSHEPDLSFIMAAALAIAPYLKEGNLVVLESTSPVGTTEMIAEYLARERADLSFPQHSGEDSDIRIAHCPERVLPGHVIRELVENDRIIGGVTPYCSQVALNLYKIIVEGECLITSARTAEMAKLTENSFRDVNIAFANELSLICDKHNIDVWELIDLANRHPRVNILSPGPGVGGHCIAIDPWMIVHQDPIESKLIRAAREVNSNKPIWVVEKVLKLVAQLCVDQINTVESIKIACLGLSYKSNIDDLRESPACEVALELSRQHPGPVIVAEPYIQYLPEALKGSKLELVSAETAILADVIVLLVDHQYFRPLTHKLTDSQRILDTRGLWRN